MSSRAAAVYRLLLRARADAFRGDPRALGAARAEIRSKFEQARPNKHANAARPNTLARRPRLQAREERDAARIDELLQEGRDAATFLREFVVQAQVNERGNIAVSFRPEHAGKEADFSLPSAEEPSSGARKPQ